MTDVICISSSDDEEDSSKKQPTTICQKRKLSTNSNDENKSKRHKAKDANEYSSDSNISSKSLTSTNSVNLKKSDSENSVNECVSPKPGSSEQHEAKHKSYRTNQSSPIKKVIKPQLVVREKISIPEPSENIFMKFLETCECKKKAEETKKILKNLKKHYDKLSSIDKDDKEFQSFLNTSVQKISNDHNDKFYTYIQEVKDEIKRRIDRPKISVSSEKKLNTNAEQQTTEETEDMQEITLSKNDMKKVKKLEKTIRQCQKRIKELEEKEVDFDEEEDSAYLREDRYKRKLVELCNALSDIVGDRMLKKEIHKKQIRRKDIPDDMTGISSVDEAIISFINSNIKQVNKLKHIKNPAAIADYLIVPDYHDILGCILKCNTEKGLELTKKKMEQLAKTAFRTIHFYLKKQRVKETEEYISSYLEVGTEADPAAIDPDLNIRLQNNKKEGDKKLQEIFKKYEDKQERLSPEDVETLSKQESVSEDESDNEICKNTKKMDSKNRNKKKIIIESDKDDESDKSVKSTESKKSESIKDKESENKNKIAENNENNSISEVSKNKEHEIEKDIGTNEIDTLENKSILDEKNIDSIEKISEDNIINADSITDKITNSCELRTCIIDASKESNCSKDNKLDTTPVVVDDDEIQILSDDSEATTKSKLNNKSVTESKERLTILRNTNNPLIEDTSSMLTKEEKSCTGIDVSKDNNDNIHVTSLSAESYNIKCKESLSTFTSLKENNKADGDNEMESSEVILDNILPNESSKKNIEIMEINDDVEVLPCDDKASDKAKELGSTEDKNSTNFIKVCSFAKPPDSWKDSLSPEKVKKNVQLPIQQALQDLSKSQHITLNKGKDKSSSYAGTRFINPLAINKSNAPTKNVLAVKNINNHNGPLIVSDVQHSRIIMQRSVSNVIPQSRSVIGRTTNNPNIIIRKILPNNHRTGNNQRDRPLSGNETRNSTLPSQQH